MGHLLCEASPSHRTPALLGAVECLLRALGSWGEPAHDALRHLLLNLRLWQGAAPEVQHQLVGLMLGLAQVSAHCVLVWMLSWILGGFWGQHDFVHVVFRLKY